jgi:uncharacterized protein YcaQ
MAAALPVIPVQSARLLFMGAQGLLNDPDRRSGRAALLKVIEQIGYVQVDSINVVDRAHHLILASRLDSYRHQHYSHLLERDRSLFEHWTHAASAIPTQWFRHWKLRFDPERARDFNSRWWRHLLWWRQMVGADAERVIGHVRDRISREGPLRSQDFEHERDTPGAWWNWKPQKAALEFLWATGELMITGRDGFKKIYDLTERVLPEHHRLSQPAPEEHIEWACSTALDRMSFATSKELAGFWNAVTQAQAEAWAKAAAKTGRIIQVVVPNKGAGKQKPSWAPADWERRLARLPDPPDRMRLLCPFDPVVRDRGRLAHLFGFDYIFEVFLPAPKRQYGYYVLPILEGDRFVGRVDPKFHRDEGILELRGVRWERGFKAKARRRRLEEAAMRLARVIGAQTVRISPESRQ